MPLPGSMTYLLASLEQEMEELGKVGFLNFRLFLTGWDSNMVSSNNTNYHVVCKLNVRQKKRVLIGNTFLCVLSVLTLTFKFKSG